MKRRGFTLIELIVVITIIALLGSMLMGALWRANITAKVDKTQGLVTRIGEAVNYKYEQYRTRRLPVDLRERIANSAAIQKEINLKWGEAANPNNTRHLALARLLCMRELQRMEMPQGWDDVKTPAVYLPASLVPSVWQSYRNRAFATPAPTSAFEDAECLYLICQTLGPEDPVTDSLKHIDVGDADDDKALEYHDAWGHPIIWFRWAPGYASDYQSLNKDTDHDPFDPRYIDNDTGRGFRLVPLVMSAGIDNTFDVTRERDLTDSTTFPASAINDPYHYPKTPFGANGWPTGTRLDGGMTVPAGTTKPSGAWADNITNHLNATAP